MEVRKYKFVASDIYLYVYNVQCPHKLSHSDHVWLISQFPIFSAPLKFVLWFSVCNCYKHTYHIHIRPTTWNWFYGWKCVIDTMGFRNDVQGNKNAFFILFFCNFLFYVKTDNVVALATCSWRERGSVQEMYCIFNFFYITLMATMVYSVYLRSLYLILRWEYQQNTIE